METHADPNVSGPSAAQNAGKLFVVLTPPSALAVSVLHAIEAMVVRALGSVDKIKLSTIEALRSEMHTRKNHHLLLYSDCPAPESVTLIKQAAPPVLVFADDPVRVAQSLQGKLGPDPIAAIRTTALSFATLHDLILYSSHKLVLAPQDFRSLDVFLLKIAYMFSLPVAAKDVAKIAQEFSARDEWAAVSSDGGRKAAAGNGIVSPFTRLFDNQPADQFYWPPALFFGTEPLGSPLRKHIDLTGPARPILYGPYMHLPPGLWEMRIRFKIAENKSGNALLVEWMEGGDIRQSARISALPESGQFQFSLQVQIVDPREPLQVRVSILEGAIEGFFEFEGVALSRQAPRMG